MSGVFVTWKSPASSAVPLQTAQTVQRFWVRIRSGSSVSDELYLQIRQLELDGSDLQISLRRTPLIRSFYAVARRFLNRVRKFDSCRGHSGAPQTAGAVVQVSSERCAAASSGSGLVDRLRRDHRARRGRRPEPSRNEAGRAPSHLPPRSAHHLRRQAESAACAPACSS
jgi:hypothetical protein